MNLRSCDWVPTLVFAAMWEARPRPRGQAGRLQPVAVALAHAAGAVWETRPEGGVGALRTLTVSPVRVHKTARASTPAHPLLEHPLARADAPADRAQRAQVPGHTRMSSMTDYTRVACAHACGRCWGT